LTKSWQKLSKNSETVRGRRGIGGRRFVVPTPGATLSHLVKTHSVLDQLKNGLQIILNEFSSLDFLVLFGDIRPCSENLNGFVMTLGGET
jgi:hypothetical protein